MCGRSIGNYYKNFKHKLQNGDNKGYVAIFQKSVYLYFIGLIAILTFNKY